MIIYSHFTDTVCFLSLAGRHFPMPSPHQVVVFSMECVGFSKSLTTFSSHSPTKSAGKIIDLVLGLYMQFAMSDFFFLFAYIEREKNFCLQAMKSKFKATFCNYSSSSIGYFYKENCYCCTTLTVLPLK